MTMGERLRRAREEAGLSQRQVCGDQITRNQLSQLEHDRVGPSVETLRYLAGQLGRPVSYFLDETPSICWRCKRPESVQIRVRRSVHWKVTNRTDRHMTILRPF